MRRLPHLLAALVLLAGPLASTGHAMAGEDRREARREQGGGRQGGGQAMGRVFGGGGERRESQQAYRPQEYRQQSQPEFRQAPRQEYRPEAYRGEQPADPRYNYRAEPQYAPQRADPRYAPRGYAAPPPSAYSAQPRRGGYMGQGGAVINDYDRYRLRAPPPGYDWVQTQRGAALVSRSTRQVFDVVPY